MSNRIGWIVGGVMGIAVAVFVWHALEPKPTPPSSATTAHGVLSTVGLNSPIGFLAGEPSSQPGDAADDYHQAVQLFQDNRQLLQTQIDNKFKAWATFKPSDQAMKLLAQINELVAQGARKQAMDYCARFGLPLEVSMQYAPADRLEEVGDCLHVLAQTLLDQSKKDEARCVLENEFLLGRHMVDERAIVLMVQRGIGLQRRALLAIAALPEVNPAANASIERYLNDLDRLSFAYSRLQKALWRYPAQPGDVFNIIQNCGDRPWRVQGLLALGMVKFQAKNRADQNKAKRLMRQFAEIDDPILSAAAKAAIDLTQDQYQSLPSK